MPCTGCERQRNVGIRVERAEAKWVVTNPANTAKFNAVPGEFSVITTQIQDLPETSAHPHAKRLLDSGYDLTLLPFDGDHVIVPWVVARAVEFFLGPLPAAA